MAEGEAELLEAAARLAAEAGQGAPVALVPLAGGKNNRVYRAELEMGPALVLKSYFRHPGDPRDRLGAEWAFLTRAWGAGVRAIPEPLACDRDRGLGLYGYAAGEKLKAEEITAAHVAEAARFILDVNADRDGGAGLAPGSEACFSMADHVARIDARVARLARLDPDAPYAEAAAELVADALRPAWDALRARLAGQGDETPFPERQIIASPSDFGFHNTLWSEERGLVFLDFEYAGRDDPAKLVGDFFACPEILTPEDMFQGFAETVSVGLGDSEELVERMQALRPAYKIKWACIVLNDFLAQDNSRRAFAMQGERDARCQVQLEKARTLLVDVVY